MKNDWRKGDWSDISSIGSRWFKRIWAVDNVLSLLVSDDVKDYVLDGNDSDNRDL